MPEPPLIETPSVSTAQIVARVSRIVGGDDFPNGERAALKRWSPGSGHTLAFHKFAARHLPVDWEWKKDEWATIVTGVAISHPYNQSPGAPPGKALAESGYSETRLERLLAAQGDGLLTLVLRSARFLRAKNVAFDWTGIAYLLGINGNSDQTRFRIARDYYRELQRQDGNQRKE